MYDGLKSKQELVNNYSLSWENAIGFMQRFLLIECKMDSLELLRLQKLQI